MSDVAVVEAQQEYGRHIVSLPNLTEIQENQHKDNEDEQ
jgi:hypothetical protein